MNSPLEGKLIVVGVTGSVAAIESPKLVRELRRKGAEVVCVMTNDAQGIIHPNVLQWASRNEVIIKIDGRTQHVEFLGKEGTAHLLLIAPCTANTIGKIAYGIDDTSVTTFTTTAFGSGIPIAIVPAMDLAMYDHPIVKENIEKLKKLGVDFLDPRIDENKAKMMDFAAIVETISMKFYPKDCNGRKIVVTAGPTTESIDPIRVLTNLSSGKMGVYIAEEAYRRGADVLLLKGRGAVETNYPIKVIEFSSSSDLYDTMKKESPFADIIIHAAAVSDFTVQSSVEKLDSYKTIQLSLAPSLKIIDEIKKWNPHCVLIGFKAESGVSENELISGAQTLLQRTHADIVVANDIGKEGCEFGSECNEVYMITPSKTEKISLMPKKEIATKILNNIVR